MFSRCFRLFKPHTSKTSFGKEKKKKKDLTEIVDYSDVRLYARRSENRFRTSRDRVRVPRHRRSAGRRAGRINRHVRRDVFRRFHGPTEKYHAASGPRPPRSRNSGTYSGVRARRTADRVLVRKRYRVFKRDVWISARPGNRDRITETLRDVANSNGHASSVRAAQTVSVGNNSRDARGERDAGV